MIELDDRSKKKAEIDRRTEMNEDRRTEMNEESK